MKRICLLLLLSLCCLPLSAQTAQKTAQQLEGAARDRAVAISGVVQLLQGCYNSISKM